VNQVSSASVTVLVIDDNPAVTTALEVLLSLHEIRTIANRPRRRWAWWPRGGRPVIRT
jgi:hypothetical protein